jgi:hypothetical protein
MKSLDQRGLLNPLLVPLILLVVMVVGVGSFAIWAFSSRQDYKNNVDKKIIVAQVKTKQDTQAADAAQYAEEAKKPLSIYTGPPAFGNITVKYPRTWSAYVEENSKSNSPVNGYFSPGFVPMTTDPKSAFALRVELTQQSYDQVMVPFNGLVQAKQATVAPYSLPKVPSAVGSRVEGQIEPNKQGVMLVLPLRNQTLKIYTEATQFKNDFDKVILPELTFQP